ncbi:MAG: Lrp/AsnC family transcriptional regulator [Chloroflexota bacterium]
MTLTDLDKQILGILFEDARTPVSEIAARLDEPVSTVHGRMRRFKSSGLIQTYRPVLDPRKLGYDVKAVVQFHRDTNGQIESILPHLDKIQNVVHFIHPLGNIDGLVTVWVRNIDELATVIDQINDIPGVIRTETLVILDEKQFAPPPIDRNFNG